MGIRIKVELRKLNGQRFARFKLAENADIDSDESVLLASAMRECGIETGNHAGFFKALTNGADGKQISRLAGVDVPAADIQAFTAALNRKGFQVT